MIEVKLTPIEIAVCKIIGNMRTMVNRAVENVNTPYNGVQSDVDEDGFIGEYAFCKHHNLFFDITASAKKGSHDCVLNGQKIDVKTTQWQNGKLMVKDTGNHNIDVYALAIFDGYDTVKFPGYCTAKRLVEEGNRVQNVDKTWRYEMDQAKLSQWKIVN